MCAPPAWNKIRSEIKSTAKNYILAVSGGVDSVFLLDFVSKCDVRYTVAYFDHGLGNGNEQFVKDLAYKYGVPFVVGYGTDIAKAKSIECEARIQRYRFLNNVKEQTNAEKILTAHHLDDNVETIMLRLMRGHDHSTLGMNKFSCDVYRPLLEVSKSTILKQAEHFRLTWLEDKSNMDNQFERNFLRNEILPKLMSKRNVQKTFVKGLGK